MLHSPKTIRKTNKESAIALFNDIIVNNDLQKVKINREDSNLSLSDMSQSGAWLEPWMIKTEEVYILLTGERLFDVLYEEDENSVIGIKSKDTKDIEDYQEDKIELAPISLKYLVGELAFKNLFKIENNVAKIIDPSISLVDSDINGFYQPLSQDEIVLISLKGYLDKAKTAILNLSYEKELLEKNQKKRNAPTKDM
jgi:hypothetical protein